MVHRFYAVYENFTIKPFATALLAQQTNPYFIFEVKENSTSKPRIECALWYRAPGQVNFLRDVPVVYNGWLLTNVRPWDGYHSLSFDMGDPKGELREREYLNAILNNGIITVFKDLVERSKYASWAEYSKAMEAAKSKQ